jgi:peptidoglycan hydrolase-like protein with peptidoglycan-binding domain
MGRHALAAGIIALLQLAISSCSEAGTSPSALAAAAAPPPPPLHMLVSTDAEHRVAEAQRRLHALGLYHGTMNGTLGPQTRNALATYQRKLKLPVTGQLDENTAYALQNDDLLHLCMARGMAAADCFGAIKQFYAALQQSDASAETTGDPTAQNTCTGENDSAECAKAVARMSLWLDGQAAAPK